MRVFKAEKNGIGFMWLWSVPVQNERRKFCLREHYFCGWLACHRASARVHEKAKIASKVEATNCVR